MVFTLADQFPSHVQSDLVPVEFEAEDNEADPFGLDQFLSEAQKGNKGKPLDGIGAGSGMAASTGGSMSGEGGSGRSKIGFAKEKK